jgi:hypothetical protein
MSSSPDVDELLQRQHRLHQLADHVYAAFLKAADDLPAGESQWRTLALACVNRLLAGLASSMGVRSRATVDMERLKKGTLAHVMGELLQPVLSRPVRISLNQEDFRALVAGKEVKLDDPAALVILSDIGFAVMLDAITKAGLAASEAETDRRKGT